MIVSKITTFKKLQVAEKKNFWNNVGSDAYLISRLLDMNFAKWTYAKEIMTAVVAEWVLLAWWPEQENFRPEGQFAQTERMELAPANRVPEVGNRPKGLDNSVTPKEQMPIFG